MATTEETRITDEEFKAILTECVLGEPMRAKATRNAPHHGNLDSNHAHILAEVSTELEQLLQNFETALGRD